MKKIHAIHIILALALATRLIFAFSWHEIWWDSGTYIGMGKYIYSAGESGLWEHIRPPIIPIILGAFWSLGLNPALFGRLFEIVLMLGIVWLTYQLARTWWDEKTAIIASLIIALSPIFHYLSFHQYTEIPSTFLVLLGLWLTTKQKYFLTGITIGIAFLTKFYAGMFIAIILIYLAARKQWKQAGYAGMGFALAVLPYFLWSWTAYGSPLATFLAAQDAISRALGCNVLRAQPWWQYFSWLMFSETKIHIMSLIGIIAFYKKWNKKHLLYLLCLTIPLLYFAQLSCRDYRYLTSFLPFIAILTALGVTWTYDKLKIKKKYVFTILLIILSIWMLNTSTRFYYGNEAQQPDPAAETYFRYFADKQITGEIWTANPIMAAHTDQKLNKIYYPIYDRGIANDFTDYIRENDQRIGAVALDNCGGGIICPPNEQDCETNTQELIQTLDQTYKKALNLQSGRCWYTIWTST